MKTVRDYRAALGQPKPADPAPAPKAPKKAPAPAHDKVADSLLAMGQRDTPLGDGHGGGRLGSAAAVANHLQGTKFAGKITANDVATILDEYKITGDRNDPSGRMAFVAIRNEPALRAVIRAAVTGQHNGRPVTSYTALMGVAEDAIRTRPDGHRAQHL